MRRLKYLFILALLAAAYKGRSQDNLSNPYRIVSDTATMQNISAAYWEMLEDIESKYTIEEVQGPAIAGRFHKAGIKSGLNDSVAKTQWIRVAIKNAMPNVAKLSIGSGSELSSFYVIRNNNQISHFATGWKYPWSKKDGLKKINAIPLLFAPGEILTVYIRKQNKAPFHVPYNYDIPLYATAKFVETEFNAYQANSLDISFIYLSFFSGVLFLASLFNFLIYRAVKSKVNLYFSLFLLGVFIWYNPVLRTILPRESALLGQYIFALSGFSILFLLFFIRHYFEVFKHFPRWDKFLLGYSIVMFGVNSAGQFVDEESKVMSLVIMPASVVFLVSVFITILININRKGKHTRVFYIAVLPLIVFILLSIAGTVIYPEVIGSIEAHNISDYIGGVCILWAVLVFSKYLFEDYGKQQQKIIQVQVQKEQEQLQFMALQKIELEKQVKERTFELQRSIVDLKATQSQLIQSEKMASLGELTAGIAHEIQNPLNFVNNFSEVNTELIDEVGEEIDKGNISEAKTILEDIKENEIKINRHGKRADAIVKGMLQHSRSSSGLKEPTDINALADEYLRLSYHGLRAKDKSFNATLKTDFDETIGKINIIPQDIGRVILNLITNAFYVVDEKKKQIGDGYEPTVSVSTKKANDTIAIKVADNGNGIPHKVVDKIFQPFFTTKPAGQGTGLGLSLSYDIVKAHGGELKVETKEGEGTEFLIQLPVV